MTHPLSTALLAAISALPICYADAALPPKGDGPDLFRVGTVWMGARQVEGKKRTQAIKLEITSREGGVFGGILTLGVGDPHHSYSAAVTGTAPASGDGPLKFETEQTGDLAQRFWGKIVNGSISFDYKGKSRHGNAIEGTGWLKPPTSNR